MFLSRIHRQNNMQKHREHYRDIVLPGSQNLGGFFSKFDYFLLALRGGFLNSRCIAYFFTYCKKMLRFLKKTTRIWLNLPISNVITRKALNVRMGKGKGGRLGINARVRAGACVFAALSVRPGLWRKIIRFVSARCSFKLYSINGNSRINFSRVSAQGASSTVVPLSAASAGTRPQRLLVKRYTTPQLGELYAILRRLRKIKTYIYFLRIFRYSSPRFQFLSKALAPFFHELQGIWRLRCRPSGTSFFVMRSSSRLHVALRRRSSLS